MNLVFRLPILLLEALVRRSAEVLGGIVAVLRGSGDEGAGPGGPAVAERPAGPPTTAPPPRRTAEGAGGPPPPTAEEALERRFEREAAAAATEPPGEPDRFGAPRHVSRDAEVVESFGDPDDVGAAIEVDEPWPGYAGEPANAIVTRLRNADEATRAVVRLYEQRHKKRATVLRATT